MSENERGATNPEESEPKELSFGEDAVGLGFNPGGDDQVAKAKRLFAEIIDMCHDKRSETANLGRGTDKEILRLGQKERYASIAITETQAAQMWVVKMLTK